MSRPTQSPAAVGVGKMGTDRIRELAKRPAEELDRRGAG